MFGKIISMSLFLSAFTVTACAQPKYENITNNQGSVGEKITVDCSIRFAQSGYCLNWHWKEMPTQSQPGSLTFKIVRPNDLDQTPVPVEISSEMEVVLWMPSMGHGSSPTTVEKVDVGSYLVSNVFFVMPGEWEIKFQIKEDKQVIDEAVVDLTF